MAVAELAGPLYPLHVIPPVADLAQRWAPPPARSMMFAYVLSAGNEWLSPVVSASWKLSFSPQHHTRASSSDAQANRSPAVSATAETGSGIWTGVADEPPVRPS